MQKLSPKLIAFDLDDTLLDKNTQIPQKNIQALQKCAQKGIYIVLCSGRAEEGILPFVRKLDIAGLKTGRFLIAINGCSVFDLHLRQQIFKRTVDADVLLKADELASESGLDSEVYSPDTIFYAKETEWTRLDVDLCHVKGEVVKDYKEFLKKGFPKMLIPGEPEKLTVLQEKLKKEFGNKAVIFTSKPFFLEILPPDCGKGEAIEFLCNYLGFGIEDAMCFGDGMNDESMIKKCGMGVAMLNAGDYIKSIADYVTEEDNNCGGVGSFIEKYVL